MRQQIHAQIQYLRTWQTLEDLIEGKLLNSLLSLDTVGARRIERCMCSTLFWVARWYLASSF